MTLDPRDVPVLLIAFNRPEPTREVFEAIRAAAPRNLYLAVDGARPAAGAEEAAACEQVRALASSVDWDCTVLTLFQEANLGCRFGVQAAIDWFFSHVEEGIIFEDDCLPDPTLFGFCAELLERYRNDPRIMMISGDYFSGTGFNEDHSYFFTRNTHIWGWATWRRAWQHFDAQLSAWPRLRESGWLLEVGCGDRDFASFWTDIFDRVHAGEIDTWDYSWLCSMWQSGALAAQPTCNLVTNIGFGAGATHTVDTGAWQARLPTEPMEFPLRHPTDVVRDIPRDAWTDRNVFKTRPPTFASRVAGIVRHLR